MAISSFFSSFSFFCLLASYAGISYGVKIPFEARSVKGAFEARADGTAGMYISNVNDIQYTTNITINGIAVQVILDTSSNDLWVSPPGGVGKYNSTGITIDIPYDTAIVSGTIGVAAFQWGPYDIQAQAFAYVEDTSKFGFTTELGIYGVLGLGIPAPASSPIISTLYNKYGSGVTWGNAVLQNIYQSHPTLPTFIGFDLSRGAQSGGSFTIGEYDSRYPTISQAPKLSIISELPGWYTYSDGVTVNGQNINVPSASYQGLTVPAGKGMALFDSGSQNTSVPEAILDAIYSVISGAVKHNISSTGVFEYIVPCNASVDVEFVFAGQKFPIHPLDLIHHETEVLLGVNTTICKSSFHGKGTLWQLGEPFLRNVYSTYNYGTYFQSNHTSEAYIQMIPKTSYQSAYTEYQAEQAKWVTQEAPELSPAQALALILLEEASESHPVDHVIVVGANGELTYSPANITAAIGDTVTFVFHPKNHTVTQSNFANPCHSLQESTGTVGFKSGFQPVAADATSFPTFQITVNDTKPIWGYCGQTGHCAAGMVFSINAVESGPNTFAAFQNLAKQTAGSAAAGNSTAKSAVNLASDAEKSGSNQDSWIAKYGPAIIGLLAGNMLILLALVILSILMYIRRGSSSKDTSGLKSVSPYYAPVKTKVDTTGQLGAYDRPYSDE